MIEKRVQSALEISISRMFVGLIGSRGIGRVIFSTFVLFVFLSLNAVADQGENYYRKNLSNRVVILYLIKYHKLAQNNTKKHKIPIIHHNRSRVTDIQFFRLDPGWTYFVVPFCTISCTFSGVILP